MKRNIIFPVLLCAAGIILCGCENKTSADVTVTQDTSAAAITADITSEDAENIAIADAGINSSDITSIKVSRDDENGKSVFEVDFFDASNEYEYEISAESGEIISKSMEARDNVPTVSAETSGTAPLDTTTVQPAVTESTTTAAPVSVSVNATTPAAKSITEAEAKSIAFDSAGVKESDVEYINVKPDRDDGRDIFDVEFYANGTEYDYEIDASNGKVLSADKELENLKIPKSTTKQSGNKITEAEAKSIAFDSAGVKESDVEYINVKPDRDDGRDIFDVEFYANGTEYDYEIDASDGKILSADKELENLKIPKSTTKQSGNKITEAEAKEIAFADAGISEADAKRVKSEFDRDDGKEIYEIEFYYNNMEYTYEINAADGAIIDKEIDRD